MNPPLRLSLEGLEDRCLLSGPGWLNQHAQQLASILAASSAAPAGPAVDQTAGNQADFGSHHSRQDFSGDGSGDDNSRGHQVEGGDAEKSHRHDQDNSGSEQSSDRGGAGNLGDNQSGSEDGQDHAAVAAESDPAKKSHNSGDSAEKSHGAPSTAHASAHPKVIDKLETSATISEVADTPVRLLFDDAEANPEGPHLARLLVDPDLPGEGARPASDKASDPANPGEPFPPGAAVRAIDIPTMGEVAGPVTTVRRGSGWSGDQPVWMYGPGEEGTGERQASASLFPVIFTREEEASAESSGLEFSVSDALAAFTPARPAAVDLALRQFLSEVENLGCESMQLLARSGVAAWVAGLAGAGVVVEVVRRRRRSRARVALAGRPDDTTLTWVTDFPGSFSVEDA